MSAITLAQITRAEDEAEAAESRHLSARRRVLAKREARRQPVRRGRTA